ncbi:hypothetical protein M1P56_16925 [Streptomyces sp. HU2014]|uniref:hypothetical protein n=1 Tax=Streptomyces sp. HU2014 TaxID=2939414 RepID=UPI00200C3CF4|nr:hypothetical protein [Streptomyces sp. HU2014]UQI45919.1 hypothetical protein M1P56_16925 [Streptomyces sp. HU2014]
MNTPSRRGQALRGMKGLPADFTAFFSLHHRAYLRYAHLQLGDAADAQWVVEDTFGQLSRAWIHVLQQPSPAAFALAALKENVTRL